MPSSPKELPSKAYQASRQLLYVLGGMVAVGSLGAIIITHPGFHHLINLVKDQRIYRRRRKGGIEGSSSASSSSSSPKRSRSTSRPVEGAEVFPPLPTQVVSLLQSTRLCHLSTSGADGIPHLSLMNFTYLPEEEIIIMTTRKDTKKFELLQSSPKVALLIHDFPSMRRKEEEGGVGEEQGGDGGKGGKGNTYSITLNGTAQVQHGQAAERYRALHLDNNEGYRQFIVGESIAVLIINIVSARMCNVQDRVTYWEVGQTRG